MTFEFKQGIVNSFYALGKTVGAGLATIGLAGAGVGVGIVFGSPVYCMERNQDHAEDFEELIANLNPEEIREVGNAGNPPVTANPLVVVAIITTSFLLIAYFRQEIWDFAHHVVGQSADYLSAQARAAALRQFSNSTPEQMQAMLAAARRIVEYKLYNGRID